MIVTIKDVEQEYHRLAAAGDYAEALALITREGHLFPDYSQSVIFYWRMLMANHLNQSTLVLQLLQEALAAGHWYSPFELHGDFQTLNGRPEFEYLLERSAERRAAVIADAVPVLKAFEPECAPQPYPWLLALHGNQSNVESFARHWIMAVSHGWFVALPQSTQPYGPGAFSWNDQEWAVPEVQQHVAAIYQAYPVDPSRAVVAGFSMGAGLALWLVLNNFVQASGLILVAPFLPTVESLLPALERFQAKGLRTYLVASDDDPYCLDVAQKLAILLPRHGIDCKLETYPQLGHSFPPPFEARLPLVLEYFSRKLSGG
jgi:predicted esterase